MVSLMLCCCLDDVVHSHDEDDYEVSYGGEWGQMFLPIILSAYATK